MLRTLLPFAAWAAVCCTSVSTQQCRLPTVGLRARTATSATDFVLLQPAGAADTWLLDRHGRTLHRWRGTLPVRDASFGPDGLLLRCLDLGNPAFAAHPEASGRVELVDWDGNVVWHFELSTAARCLHHGARRLPDGDLLLLAWEKKDLAALAGAGRDPALNPPEGYLLNERVLRLRPDRAAGSGGTTAWEWSAWDHAIQDRDPSAPTYGVIADAPGRIDLQYGRDPMRPEWPLLTAADVDAAERELLLTAHGFEELWVVDFATTTAAAAGPAGELLYRWGNPEAYGRGGFFARKLDGPLAACWIPPGRPDSGRILAFSAGWYRGHSAVIGLEPPRNATGGFVDPGRMPFGPADFAGYWSARDPESFHSTTRGHVAPLGADRIVAGALGGGTLVEVTGREAAWRYVSPLTPAGPLIQGDRIPGAPGSRDNALAGTQWLAADHPGLVGRRLASGEVLELGYGVEVLVGTGSRRGGAVDHGLCISFDVAVLPLRLREARPGALGALLASWMPTTTPIPPTAAGLLSDGTWLVAAFRLDLAGTTMWPILGELTAGTDVWMQFGTFADGPLGIEVEASPLIRMWRR